MTPDRLLAEQQNAPAVQQGRFNACVRRAAYATFASLAARFSSMR